VHSAIPDVKSSGWTNAKIKEELGYTPNYLYLNEEDERKVSKMNEMDREILLHDRSEKAEAAKFKYERQKQNILQKK